MRIIGSIHMYQPDNPRDRYTQPRLPYIGTLSILCDICGEPLGHPRGVVLAVRGDGAVADILVIHATCKEPTGHIRIGHQGVLDLANKVAVGAHQPVSAEDLRRLTCPSND